MVVGEHSLYATVAVIALVGTIGALVYVRQFEGQTRRHMLLGPIALGLLTIGYAGMAADAFALTTPEGDPVYLTRFGVYSLTYVVLMSYAALIAGAAWRYRLIPAIAVLGFTWGTVTVQLAEPPIDALGTLIVLASLVAVLWSFFGPITRAAQDVAGERRLLFMKLRNLAALIFTSYLLLALTTRQALGFLDAFTGVFTVAYVDLIAHLGFVGLILYSKAAVALVATQWSTPVSTLTAMSDEPTTAPADD